MHPKDFGHPKDNGQPKEPDLTCEQAEEQFSALLEGELSDAAKAAMTAHLDACPGCKEGFERFCEALEALHAYEPQAVPQSFIESVSGSSLSGYTLQPKSRKWSAVLGWAAAAAAAIFAVYAHFTKPEYVEIQVPVDRLVTVEKPVPVPTPVEVPVPMRISVPVHEGVLEVVRAGRVITVPAGESLVFMEGDEIRIPGLTHDLDKDQPPVRLVVDLTPIAAALEEAAAGVNQTALSMSQAALAMVERWEPEPLQSPGAAAAVLSTQDPGDLEERDMPVTLVWESNGSLVLETYGPYHEVIPQLIGLLEHEDPQINVVAEGRLESIQERLNREYGIPALQDPVLKAEAENDLERIASWFTGKEEDRPEAFTTADRWGNWWSINQKTILGLTRYLTD
ncbi:MAG: anti-sigma factor family protein [Planctomycetota bacterium]